MRDHESEADRGEGDGQSDETVALGREIQGDGSSLSNGAEDGDAPVREGLSILSQSRLRTAMAAGLAALAASAGAVLWRRGRQTGNPTPSSNLTGQRWRKRVMRLARRRSPTMQDRIIGLVEQGGVRARELGTIVMRQARRNQQPPSRTRWQVAQERVQANRVTLATLAVAAGLLAAARWIDRRQR